MSEPRKFSVKTMKRLAALARKCGTKKELKEHLRGTELDESWRILQLQNQRRDNQSAELEPQKRSKWEKRGLKRTAWKAALIWPCAYYFGANFRNAIAARIEKSWTYRWQSIKYSLACSHSNSVVKVEHRRSASSYTHFYTELTFNCLQHTTQVIGGLLTIFDKADAEKLHIPCWWMERRKTSPGLIVKQGFLLDGTYHQKAATLEEALAKRARAIARALEGETNKQIKESLENYVPANGWVNRKRSIGVGNCGSGTDNFIQNRLIPFFQQHGFRVGNLAGVAVRKSLVLELETSSFTQKL